MKEFPLNEVQKVSPTAKTGCNRRKRQTSYYAPPTTTSPQKIWNSGNVIVMPPPGKAPEGYPQPGQPGGGALPETNPYIADMAPEGTVPIAIFPPFVKDPLYPARCVIFSELTDFEDTEINDYGNVQVDTVRF